jgi:hypothetical protein
LEGSPGWLEGVSDAVFCTAGAAPGDRVRLTPLGAARLARAVGGASRTAGDGDTLGRVAAAT